MTELDWLPALQPFDWNDYAASLERAYGVFRRDFELASSRPTFLGRKMELKWHPAFDGKSATFWHFVTEGRDESTRTPNRDRIERIAWPRALIESAHDGSRVRLWCEMKKGDKRWHLAVSDFSYLVVVADRKKYVLPWTAFVVDQEHQQAKLRRAWEAWQGEQKS